MPQCAREAVFSGKGMGGWGGHKPASRYHDSFQSSHTVHTYQPVSAMGALCGLQPFPHCRSLLVAGQKAGRKLYHSTAVLASGGGADRLRDPCRVLKV